MAQGSETIPASFHLSRDPKSIGDLRAWLRRLESNSIALDAERTAPAA